MKTKLFLTGLSIFLGVLFLSSQTFIKEGPVSGIWTKDNSPYLIQGKILIPHGKTLKIEAGVEVIFQTIKGLQVHGRLLAVGNNTNSILFTSSSPSKGWSGIAWDGSLSANLKHEQGSRLAYCIFKYCKDFGEFQVNSGGAIRILNYDNIKIKNCTFEFNESLLQSDIMQSGGAITLVNSNITISHCIFRYNRALHGGAILISDNADPIIDNCLFHNNFSVYSGAAIALDNHSHPNFINCTFTENYALKCGGVFYIDSYSRPILNNCILWGNSAIADGEEVFFKDKYSGISVFNSNIEGGKTDFGGEPFIIIYKNNIDKYPMWVNKSLNNYKLLPFSPCLDIACSAGGDLPANWQCPCDDLSNNKRISGCELDIGCYEYQVITDPHEEGDQKTSTVKARIFPHPVRSISTLNIYLDQDTKVKITLFDISGRVNQVVADQHLAAGDHQFQLDASNLANGIYILDVTTEAVSYTDKIIVEH